MFNCRAHYPSSRSNGKNRDAKDCLGRRGRSAWRRLYRIPDLYRNGVSGSYARGIAFSSSYRVVVNNKSAVITRENDTEEAVSITVTCLSRVLEDDSLVIPCVVDVSKHVQIWYMCSAG